MHGVRAREPVDLRVGTVRRVDSGSLPDRLPTAGAPRAPGPAGPGHARPPAGAGPVAGLHRTRPPAEPGAPVDGAWSAERDGGGVAAALARRGRRRLPPGEAGVEANARLTGTVAVVLFVLLAVEGLTILSIRSLISVHVFVGMLLVPPVLLKIGSTGWRFTRYYLGAPAYRRKGPPPPLLRLLGPLVVVLTLAVLGTGVALLLGPTSWRTTMLFLHKATFVVWLMVMAVHVLGHLLDTARLAPRDFAHRTRRQVDGAGARQWAVVASLAVGLVLGVLVLPSVGHWLVAGNFSFHP